MEVSIGNYEIYCNVIQVDDSVESEAYVSLSSNMVSIKVIATFMPYRGSTMEVEVEEEEEEDDDDECETRQDTFLVGRDRFMHEGISRSNVRQMLLDMDVPVHEVLIDQILSDVRRLVIKHNVDRRKILHLVIKIEVPQIIIKTANDDADLGQVPATKSSIDALDSLKVEGCMNEQCSICLEEILIGSEAIRMPCSHLYHHRCICNWLQRSRACPLCRFEVA